MREIRQSGSEGGVAQANALLLPLSYEVNFVDLCEQPCPGGAGLLGRYGLIHGVLGGCAEAWGCRSSIPSPSSSWHLCRLCEAIAMASI